MAWEVQWKEECITMSISNSIILKKLLGVILIVAVACAIFMFTIAEVNATYTPKMNIFQVQDRVTKLYKNYNKTSFTNIGGVYGKKDPHNHSYHSKFDCDYCSVLNVIKTKKVKKEYPGGITASHMPYHYSGGYSYSYGSSCCGFASFAGFYIFGNGKNCDCVNRKIGTFPFNKANKSKINSSAGIGDIIRFDDNHSAVYLATTDKGVFVLDCNWFANQNSVVRVHTVPWSSYSEITFSRGTNRYTSTLSVQNLNAKSVSKGVSLKWDGIDGADKYQVARATSPNGKYKSLTITKKKTYKDKSAKAGRTYYYKVRAINYYTGYKPSIKKMASGCKWFGYYSDVVKIKK